MSFEDGEDGFDDSGRPLKVPKATLLAVEEEIKQLDGTAHEMRMEYAAAFSVLAAIQLGVKHSALDPLTKELATQAGMRIQNYLGGPTRPKLEKLLEEGWRRIDGVRLH